MNASIQHGLAPCAKRFVSGHRFSDAENAAL
jgi:hypothetical protein